ncbi:O-antigen ligase family protein [Aliarcobacter butzleri]|nr:O-antigen ligase family protein [Aliarcobacter butzleri]
MIGTEDLSYAFVQIKINKVFLYSILFIAIIRKEFINKFFSVFFFALLINVIWSYLIFFNIVDFSFNTSGYLPLLEKIDHAFFVMIGISYSLYRLLNYKDKVVFKMLFILFICIESFNIFITNNKTMMFLYLLVILITTIYIYKNNVYKIFFISIVFFSFIFIVLNYFLPSVKNNLIREVKTTYKSLNSDDYNGSMAARIGISKYALSIISENKLFGLGTGDHALEIIKRIKESDLKEKNFNSYNMLIINLDTGKAVNLHNTYLQILVQFGIIGLIAFLNIFYQIARNISTKANVSSYILLIILIIILVQFNTGWDFQFGNLGNFFILMVSLLINSISKKENNTT